MKDKDIEIIMECLLDLNNRLRDIENKFSIKEEDWEIWHKLRKVALIEEKEEKRIGYP